MKVTRTAENPHTAAIARFAAETRVEDVPSEVLAHAQWDILDTIGCALFGQTLPIAAILRTALGISGGSGTSVVWGGEWTASPEIAALVNGTLTHSFELDDLHAKAIVHPGGVTLPALLAVGPSRHVTGRELVKAHVVGLEIAARVGLAAGIPLLRRGWHNNGVIGVFGSAAGTASLLELDSDRALHAIGIAGSLACGLMAAQYGAMVKRLHAGQAAQTGLRAALLAEAGFTGIERLFEEEYGGWLSTFVDSHDIAQLSADLGSRWETQNVGFKYYAACGSSHTTIDILLDLRARQGFVADEVDHVIVTGSSATRDHVGWRYVPNSATTAQMNLPYAAAVALIDGRVFVDQFGADRIADPGVVELTSRITVEADPEIDKRGPSNRHEVRVEVVLRDGRRLQGHAVHAKGSASKPLTEAERTEKFLALASKRLGADGAESVLRAVMGLVDAEDTTELLEALRPRVLV